MMQLNIKGADLLFSLRVHVLIHTWVELTTLVKFDGIYCNIFPHTWSKQLSQKIISIKIIKLNSQSRI